MKISTHEVDSEPLLINKIVELEKQNKVPLWSKQNFIDSIESKDYFKILLFGDLAIGFIIARFASDQCEILNIAIDVSYRLKGYASILLDGLIKECQKKNIKELFLEVRESNLSAIKLYDKYNFNEVGLRKNYYSTDKKEKKENAIIMALYLEQK